MDKEQAVTSAEFLNTALTYMMARDLDESEIDTIITAVGQRVSSRGITVDADRLLEYKAGIMNIKRSINIEGINL